MRHGENIGGPWDMTNNIKIIKADSNTPPDIFFALSQLDKAAVGSDGWSEQSFRSEAEKDNGYVLYVLIDGEAAALLTGYYACGEGDITSVAVAPKYRRQGLAKALIARFEELLPDDAEKLFLEVRQSNENAAALYKKCGFEQISLRKNFYSDPRENAIVMMKAEV